MSNCRPVFSGSLDCISEFAFPSNPSAAEFSCTLVLRTMWLNHILLNKMQPINCF